MKCAVLFTGGKDSVYSTYLVQQWGWDISTLLTILPERKDSWMFHWPGINLAPKIAEAMELDITLTRSPEDEEELVLKHAVEEIGAKAIISGVNRSDYQRTRLDRIAYDLGIYHFAPLWHKGQDAVSMEFLDAGFKAIFVSCSAYGLTQKWIGRKMDAESLEELKVLRDRYGVSVLGEGGEFETMVLDGPNFSSEVRLERFRSIWEGDRGFLEIDKAKLISKYPTL
jgi:ABC transporter with metal-binding/Fe-S-binding domain ATP-binding protein